MEKMGIFSQDSGLIQDNRRFMHCAYDSIVVSRCNAIRKLDLDIPLQNQPVFSDGFVAKCSVHC